MDYNVSLPIVGNKGKKANLRMDVKENKASLIFRKRNIPYPLIQFKKFDLLCFLISSVLRFDQCYH